VASSRAIVARAESAAAASPDGFLGRRLASAGQLHIEDVRDAVEAGDDDASRIVVAAGRALGRAIAAVIGVLDVEYIVLHGSVASMGAPWLDAVREEARERSLTLLAKEVAIDLAPPIGDLVVMGASALLLSAELGLVGARAA
jgi:predicted NBD/HSP70 family sugar kinase